MASLSDARTEPARRLRPVAIASAALLLIALWAGTDVAAGINSDPTALAVAQAIAVDPAIVTGASFVTKPPTTGTAGIGDTPLNAFPQHGTTYGILSSGNAGSADDGGQGSFASGSMGGGHVRGNTDYDVTILRVDLAAPAGSDCLTITFRFMSEEFPEYVGSSFNEAFIAELDSSTWSVSGTTISAPNNFAFDQNGNVVSINAVGTASMTAAGAAGTIYDGGTNLLQASKAITAGAHSLYLSIFDMADSGYDSAVFLDKLVVGTNGPGGCEEGAVPAVDPSAAFTFAPLSPLQGQAVQFTDGSSDPDGTITAWAWDFGDGQASTLKNPSHTFADDGTYTVTLTVTDNSGATDTETKTVVVANAAPSVSFTFSPANPNEGQSVAFTATASDSDGLIVSFAWTFGDGETSTAQSPSHVFADDGSYSVTITVTDDDGATAFQTKTVVVFNIPPVADFTYAPAAPNQGTAVTFTDLSTDTGGTIVSWAWSFGDGDTSTEEDPVHVFADDGAYAVTLTVTDDDGATASKTRTVSAANTPPVADFTFSPTAPNQGQDTVVFADLSTDVDGTIVEWAWDFADGGTSNAQNPSYLFVDNGLYEVQLTVTDDDGATHTATLMLEVLNTAPEPEFSFLPVTPNQGESVAFTDLSTDPDGQVVAWSWTFGDGGTSSSHAPTHIFADDGAYTVSLTVRDDDGTQRTRTHVVSVLNTPPVASFSHTPQNPNQGAAVAFTDLSSDADGTVASWAWDFGDGQTSTLQNPSQVYANIGTYVATLTVTDDDGTASAHAVSITVVNTPPVAGFGWSPAAPNQAETVSFTDLSSDADGSIVAWAWDFGDGASSTDAAPSHVFDDGAFTVSLTVTDDDGDFHTKSVVLDVANTLPVSDFAWTPTAPSQILDSVAFTDLSSDADGSVVAWAWDFGDGANSAVQDPVHTFADEGLYVVTLTVTDNDGGVAMHTAALQVLNIAPTADFAFAPNVPHQNEAVTFSDLSTDADGTIMSWAWDFGDGATSTAASPAHAFAQMGDYLVTLTVTDDDGATAVRSVIVGVANALPVADFSFAPNLPNQVIDTIQFTDLSSDSDGTLVGWAWDLGDGATASGPDPSHVYADIGSYIVTLTVTDDDGDTHARSHVVDVVNTPATAQFAFLPALPRQVLDTVQFEDLSSDIDGVVVSWAWDFGDGASSTLQNAAHVYGDVGTYIVVLTVTDDDGDTSTHTVAVTVVNLPAVADFTFLPAEPNQILDTVQFADASADADGTIVSWAWDFGDGATSSAQNPTHVYGDLGSYTVTLTVTDDDGEGSTHAVVVTVVNTPPVPDFSLTPAVPTQAIDTVQFSDLSSDIDGAIASWAWDFGDGAVSSDASPVHIFADAGDYLVSLSVTDDDGATVTKTLLVTVLNADPVADFSFSPATPNQILDTVAFSDLSADPDGTIVSWAWDFGDGATSTEESPTHLYGDEGTYVVSLTVTDDDGASHTRTTGIQVLNTLPTAAFGFLPTLPRQILDVVTFTDLSTDSDGTIVAWSWDFGDGDVSSAQNPTHVFGDAGTYVVTLTVTDDDGATDSASTAIQVTNVDPVADFSWSPSTPNQVVEPAAFADLSTDADGTIVSWQWDFGDGTQGTDAAPVHIYADIGVYTVTLMVTDDDGATHTVTRDVTIVNTPPAPAFSWAPDAPLSLDAVPFADLSSDIDGTIVSWQWDFGDGATSDLASPEHTYAHPGIYVVVLSVTDDDGDTSNLAQSVPVQNRAPVAAFAAGPNPATTAQVVTFTDLSLDLDGSVVAWGWDFGDGNASGLASPSHQYADDGLYAVVLTVTDDSGDTNTTSLRVEVMNVAAVPLFAYAPHNPTTQETVAFSDLSHDTDGTIVSWEWDFNDGTMSAEPSPQHQFLVERAYVVCLTVTDDDAAESRTCEIIPVLPTVMTGRAFAAMSFGIYHADSTYREVTRPTTWASYGHDLAAGPLVAGGMEGVVTATIGRVESHAEVGYASLSLGTLAGVVDVQLEDAIIDVVSTCRSEEAFVSGHLRVTVAGATVLDVDLAGNPNQVTELPGGIRIVINEQRPIAGMDSGLRVRAVVVETASGETVLGHAQAGLRHCFG